MSTTATLSAKFKVKVTKNKTWGGGVVCRKASTIYLANLAWAYLELDCHGSLQCLSNTREVLVLEKESFE